MTKDNISARFWEQVAERAAPTEYTVGQLVLIEDEILNTSRYAVITETWVDGDGRTQARVRAATADEIHVGANLALVIVVGQ